MESSVAVSALDQWNAFLHGLPGLGTGLLITLIFIVFAFAVAPIGWRMIDRLTPGDLNEELVPTKEGKQPNLALAVVVASMFLGFCVIIAAAIH